MTDRYFDNFMPDFIEETSTAEGANEEEEKEERSVGLQKESQDSLLKLLFMPYPTLSTRLKRAALDLKQTVVGKTWGFTHERSRRISDFTLYTGALGTAFLLFKSFQVTGNKNDLNLCSEIIRACDSASLHARKNIMQESGKDMNSKFAKLEKFEGTDFRRWQKKMHFLLTGWKVVYVLSTPAPEEGENETLEQTRRRNKWENDDYVCRGFILNYMSDSLFDIYQNHASAKTLWDALEAKYMAEDASSKKFLVSNWNNYKMVDSRPVMEQYNEIMRILGQFEQHHMKMDESISVSSVIDKLPPSWKDFKHTLKHQKEELSLVQLGSHLRIEEGLRDQESGGKGKEKMIPGSSVNMVEDSPKQKNNKFNKKRKRDDHPKGANKKDKMVCWYCNKPGHLKRDCRLRKNKGCASASHHHGSTSGNGSKDHDPKPNQG